MNAGIGTSLRLATTAVLLAGLLFGFAGAVYGAETLATIEVTPRYVTMPAGGTQQFTVTGKDAQGNPVPLGDPQVVGTGGTVTVTQDSVTHQTTVTYVAGQQTGDYYFQVWDASVSGPPWATGAFWGSADIKIAQSVPPHLASIQITPTCANLNVGDQQMLTATGVDQQGNPYNDFDSASWSTSGGGSLAPSGSTCTYTATGYGEHTVTCTVVSDGQTYQGSASVNVVPPHLASIEITPTSVNLDIGDQQTFTATGRDQYGDPYTFSDVPVWTTSGGGSLAPSGSTCTYTATGYGEHTLTCTVVSDGKTYQDTASVNVVPPHLASIEVTPSCVNLDVGDQQTFTATGRDQYGDPYAFPNMPVWTISGGGSIDPNGTTCTYIATGAGHHSLTCASSAGESAVKGTASIGVGTQHLASIEVTPSCVNLDIGDQQVFTATGKDQFGHPYDALEFMWEATGGSITPDGLYIAGRTPGEYRVSARAKGTAIVGESQVTISGVSCSDSRVTITRQGVTADPQSDPATYDPSCKPPSVLWQGSLGFHVRAAGPDGSYDMSITFPSPVDPESKLFQLPYWVSVDWDGAGTNTIDVRLDITGGELVAEYVLAAEFDLDDGESAPMTP